MHNRFVPIPDFDNYLINDEGKVWSTKTNKFLRPQQNQYGHLYVFLRRNKQTNKRYIHRLVLETFIGQCPEGMECRHLNGNPKDNSLANLKWGTRSENHFDCTRHGNNPLSSEKHPKGEQVGLSKLTNTKVRWIRFLWKHKIFNSKELGKLFGVSHTVAWLAATGRSWRHV